jgi:hypothetical protein
MANVPAYAVTPNTGVAQISVANTARDGTGTIAAVVTAGASGTRIDGITITATGTSTAGMIRLFVSDGTNIRLWTEVPVLAVTPSATLAAFSVQLTSNNAPALFPLTLKTGFSLRAATNNAETFNVIAHFAGDF